MSDVSDYSRDELLTFLEDAYDDSIAPMKLKRSDRNKLHLMFKADSAGLQLINKLVLTLKRRFDPLYCPDGDLKSTARIAGTDFLPAKASIVQITAVNTSAADSAVLATGKYLYQSSSGEIFSFTLDDAVMILPTEAVTISALSNNTGAFPVENNTDVAIQREDSAEIDADIVFSTEDNSGYLGYDAETNLEFRKRMLTDANRQDEIKQIESGIKALSNVFECNCVFNPLTEPVAYDGVTLAPHELLVVITGIPTADIAKVVASHTVHKTHVVDADDVVYYEDTAYVGGRYPVYFTRHQKTDYNLNITYSYDSRKLKTAQVDSAYNTLLARYKSTNRHVDSITEFDMYTRLNEAALANVALLNVNLLVGSSEVPYVTVPRTRIPRLVTVTYTAIDTAGS